MTVHHLPGGGKVTLRSPAGSSSGLWAVDISDVPSYAPIRTHFRHR